MVGFALLIIVSYTLLLGFQDDVGPQQPIVLIHADSVIGIGSPESGIREFLGAVKFIQGNVTVTCDRAVQNLQKSTVDLFGRVVIKQAEVTLKAPLVTYNAITSIAVAPNGVVVDSRTNTIIANSGTYSTLTSLSQFYDNVNLYGDSVKVRADTLFYDRRADTSDAFGNVWIVDSVGALVMRGNNAQRKPGLGYMRLTGNAEIWRMNSVSVDTVYLAADTIISRKRIGADTLVAIGGVSMVQRGVSSRSDTMTYSDNDGKFHLLGSPVLWSDSTLLIADTILAYAPERVLDSIVGRGKGLMISRSDSTRPERYDQVGGDRINLTVQQDTIKKLIATGSARSITYRTEEERGEGLATVAADTIKVSFNDGIVEDVFWLGGVEGEHHPEPVVAGREGDYRLPGFRWRTDRPLRKVIQLHGIFRLK